MSNILESIVMGLKARTWLCLLMLVANFFFVYGAILYFNKGQAPGMYYAGLGVTLALALILAFPNTQPPLPPEMRDPKIRD